MTRGGLPLGGPLQAQLAKLGAADLVVGIPSYNNAGTIAHVVRSLQAGLAKYFPGQRAVLLNSDGGSSDGTQEAVLAAAVDGSQALVTTHPLQAVTRIVTPYTGIPGKGSALRTIFQATECLKASACMVVDADLRSITPGWVDHLLTPVTHGDYDFVAPLYRRHKFDGTITNSIVYPMTRSLYGKRIRQPIGGDFGLSGRLASHYLDQDVWESDVARFGIDIWMTTTAIADGFKACQSFLGAKIHDAKDPGLHLAQMLQQVMASLLDLMVARAPVWRGLRGSELVPLFGLEYAVGLEPVAVDRDRMVRIFRSGHAELKPLWERVLRPATVAELDQTVAHERGVPNWLWVSVLHDFALAYRDRVIERSHLLQSLTPLYLGRVATFIEQAWDLDAERVEELIEAQCLEFEALKPELEDLWEGSGRTTCSKS